MDLRAVPKYPDYSVTKDGEVFRTRTYAGNPTCKPCKPRMKKGYLVAHISQGGITCDALVHRMVWEAFCGPIPDGLQINHLNGRRDDNRLDNLETCTISENAIHKFRVNGYPKPNYPSPGSKHGQAKLHERDIPEIRKLYAQGMFQADIAKQYGVSQVLIGKVVRGDAWKHVPLTEISSR